MKLKDINIILNEIRMVGPVDRGDYKDFVGWGYKSSKKVKRNEEMRKGFTIFMGEEDEYGYMKVVARKDRIPAGYAGIKKFKDGVMIGTLGVIPEMRGKGLATLMYDYIVDHFGKVYSGNTQTKYSMGLWRGFVKKGYNVNAINLMTKDVLPVEIINDMLVARDGKETIDVYREKKKGPFRLVLSKEGK